MKRNALMVNFMTMTFMTFYEFHDSRTFMTYESLVNEFQVYDSLTCLTHDLSCPTSQSGASHESPVTESLTCMPPDFHYFFTD